MATAIVIGGGFAGLSAAVTLADAGVVVHLFEARPTLGGRANAFHDPRTGESIDNGQHILAGCYDGTLAFLQRLDTARCLHRPSTLRVAMIDDTGRRTELVCPALPAPFNLVAGVAAWDALSARDRLALLSIGRAVRGKRPAAPSETVRQWLRRHHQSPRLCHLFWEPLALAALNQSIDEAAAEMFVAVTSRMFGDAPDGATILVPAVPLDDLYVHPACRVLSDAGGAITTQAKPRVVIEGDRVSGVRVGDAQVPAAVVISAVPWFALRDLFDPPPMALASVVNNADALGAAPIVTVNVWLDEWRSPDAMLGLPGRTFQWLFDRRRFLSRAQTYVSLVASGADAVCAQDNETIVRTAMDELHAALPETRRATLRHASVVRERRATFSLKPGSPPRPPTSTPVAGLFLAGDWIDTGLPATIESAVISGRRAAAAALRHLQT
jgi:zeta-carotene desaturase